jgi:CrcB protein
MQNSQWLLVLFVGLGGFVGSISRYLINTTVLKYSTISFPISTFIVNILGGLLIGFFMSYFLSNTQSELARAFIITGFLGGLTTFSTFSYETVSLFNQSIALAITNIAINVIGSLLFLVLGHKLYIFLTN